MTWTLQFLQTYFYQFANQGLNTRECSQIILCIVSGRGSLDFSVSLDFFSWTQFIDTFWDPRLFFPKRAFRIYQCSREQILLLELEIQHPSFQLKYPDCGQRTSGNLQFFVCLCQRNFWSCIDLRSWGSLLGLYDNWFQIFQNKAKDQYWTLTRLIFAKVS